MTGGWVLWLFAPVFEQFKLFSLWCTQLHIYDVRNSLLLQSSLQQPDKISSLAFNTDSSQVIICLRPVIFNTFTWIICYKSNVIVARYKFQHSSPDLCWPTKWYFVKICLCVMPTAFRFGHSVSVHQIYLLKKGLFCWRRKYSYWIKKLIYMSYDLWN